MRLDQYLRASRLVVRRTLGQELCDAGAVKVNGRAAKSARNVEVGDEIELDFRQRTLRVRVTAVPEARQTSRARASTFYEVVADVRPSPPEINEPGD